MHGPARFPIYIGFHIPKSSLLHNRRISPDMNNSTHTKASCYVYNGLIFLKMSNKENELVVLLVAPGKKLDDRIITLFLSVLGYLDST